MKKYIFIESSKTVIAIVLFFVIMSGCYMQNRSIYTTHTGKYVTIWRNNYIIFGRHDGNQPPIENYIKLNNYKGLTDVFFKKNDSILIFRMGDKNSIDLVFDKNKYHVEVFYNTWDDIQEFKRRTSYQDTLVDAEYCFYEARSVIWPTFNECIGDSMYIKNYEIDHNHFLFFMMDIYQSTDSVFSRYDERFNNRMF